MRRTSKLRYALFEDGLRLAQDGLLGAGVGQREVDRRHAQGIVLAQGAGTAAAGLAETFFMDFLATMVFFFPAARPGKIVSRPATAIRPPELSIHYTAVLP